MNLLMIILFINFATIGHAVVSHHWEQRDGDCVRGGYSFLDSDGRVRVVQYHVHGNKGFRAVVNFRRQGNCENNNNVKKYPFWHESPIQLRASVGKITQELLYGKITYPDTTIY
ncbi:hypothetical protein FQR65_LT09919 [Abscondita terminalis]|nr:hypothetical protein FQR65_LT09919 [Abscondita terminalis]